MKRFKATPVLSNPGDSKAPILTRAANLIAIALAMVSSSLFVKCIAQPTAVLEWMSTYDGPAHGVDLPARMVLDPWNRPIITGRSSGSGTGQDYATVVFDTTGTKVHELRYNGGIGINAWDEANAVATDDAGNIYVTGYSNTQGIVTVKYSSAGDIIWQHTYPPDSTGYQKATDLALGPAGDVFVAGYESTEMYSGLRLLRYSSDGQLLTTGTFGDDTSSYNDPRVVVGPAGKVYVTSSHSFDIGSDVPGFNAATVCFDSLGTVLWSDFSGDGAGRRLTVDRNGDLLIIRDGDPFAIVKYDPAGNTIWDKNYDGTGNELLVISDVCIAPDNSIIVSGYNPGAPGYDAYIQKCDPEGNVLWRKAYSGPGDTWDFGSSVAIDGQGNVYTTGVSQIPYSWSGVFTVKYGPQGDHIWTALWDRGPHTISRGEFIALDDSGRVHVGGSSADTTGWDYLVLRYRQDSGSTVDGLNMPQGFVLLQNFPNPFNPSTTIRYGLPIRSHVTLTVFNMLGQEVATLVEGEKESGYHEVHFDAPGLATGVYMYRVQTGEYVYTQKMLVVR